MVPNICDGPPGYCSAIAGLSATADTLEPIATMQLHSDCHQYPLTEQCCPVAFMLLRPLPPALSPTEAKPPICQLI